MKTTWKSGRCVGVTLCVKSSHIQTLFMVAPGDKYAKSESCRVHVLMTSRGMKESVL